VTVSPKRKRREILDWVGRVDNYDDYEPKRLRDEPQRGSGI
jgi:hypothetical protein